MWKIKSRLVIPSITEGKSCLTNLVAFGDRVTVLVAEGGIICLELCKHWHCPHGTLVPKLDSQGADTRGTWVDIGFKELWSPSQFPGGGQWGVGDTPGVRNGSSGVRAPSAGDTELWGMMEGRDPIHRDLERWICTNPMKSDKTECKVLQSLTKNYCEENSACLSLAACSCGIELTVIFLSMGWNCDYFETTGKS